MDPFSIAVELELATLILAGVGGVASWLHTRQQRALRRQRERHHQEMQAQAERHHQERLQAIRAGQGMVIEGCDDKETMAPARRRRRTAEAVTP